MSDTTPNLELPYILPSQAQKHVTHNEALQRLDALTQLVIADSSAGPPASPADGACHAVLTGATGAWSGKAGKIAVWQDDVWVFLAPRAGWRAVFLPAGALRIHDGTDWKPYDALAGLGMIGVNTTADAVNRLAVSADATLLTHAGHGHQVKINKAAPGDTASLLFQSGWSGRAEMGLSGVDSFAIKVSADGTSWLTGLAIGAGGQVTMPQRPLARATLGGGPLTPASGSNTGFTSLGLSQGGFTLGAAVAGGGFALVVPVSAVYLVMLRVEADPEAAFSVAVKANGVTTIATLRETDAAPSWHGGGAIGLAALAAGDALTLEHAGTAALDFGYDRTELIITMM